MSDVVSSGLSSAHPCLGFASSVAQWCKCPSEMLLSVSHLVIGLKCTECVLACFCIIFSDIMKEGRKCFI